MTAEVFKNLARYGQWIRK